MNKDCSSWIKKGVVWYTTSWLNRKNIQTFLPFLPKPTHTLLTYTHTHSLLLFLLLFLTNQRITMTRPSSLSSNDSYQLAQLAVLVISGLRSSTESWSTIDKCEKTTRHWNLLFFCNRLITITKSSCASVRLALLYLFRLRVTVPLDKAPWTWKDTRLFTVVLMLASKFLEDTTYESKVC